MFREALRGREKIEKTSGGNLSPSAVAAKSPSANSGLKYDDTKQYCTVLGGYQRAGNDNTGV